METTIDEEIAEIKRELNLRKRFYPGWIEKGKLKKDDANRQFITLRNALKRLENIKKDFI